LAWYGILQEFIEFEQYVRCISLGQEEVLLIKYDPRSVHIMLNMIISTLNSGFAL
jgi:hypothetical protein